MARAGCTKHVLAVIGDGSLSNGLTFEALNFVGMKRQKLIVVLNDNKMFISHRVGAIADYLSRTMTSKKVREVKDEIKTVLQHLPVLGDRIYRLAKYIEGNLKGAVTEGLLFEELGFRYVGPIDGHNLDHLIQAFTNVSAMPEPIFLHVITKKGYGYIPAMRDPEHFHGIGRFDMETGEVMTDDDTLTFSDVFGRIMTRLAKRDPRIVAISAAMTSGTGLKQFAQKFPDRFFDVGIAEGHAVTMAAGMALYGLKPVVAIYSTFLQRGYDEIIHDVALQNAPVVFAVDRAGLVAPTARLTTASSTWRTSGASPTSRSSCPGTR
jgi:1-deoxy-D-xylulose-5-phosphate synthase